MFNSGTPPTPARSDVIIADPRYISTTQWTRSASTPRSKPKRAKKEKTEKTKSMMPGDKPVPILSEDCEGPILAIEQFVHRTAETRHKEVEGKNGYTPRPMNNFMLYRKAYQDKAKKVSSQTNHQIVSVIVAASWKNEAKEIKEKFARYAQIEKEHHILAFPNYQFRPNKTNKGRKRKAGEYEEDGSDLDEADWNRGTGSKVQRKNVLHTLPGSYTPDQSHQYMQMAHPYPQAGYAVDYTGQPIYYDQTAQWPQYEDVSWPMETEYQNQLMQSYNTSALSGLPGGGNALLDPDFSNAVFDDPGMTAQSVAILQSNDHGSGAFTQDEFAALDHGIAASNWQDSRPSMDGKTLTAAFPETAGDFDDEYFVNPT